MLQSTIDTLNRQYHRWELYKKCGELIGIPPHEINELIDVWRAEVDPYFHLNRACPICVKEFFKQIFTWYDSRTQAQQVI